MQPNSRPRKRTKRKADKGKIDFLGRKVPTWTLLIALAIAGAGAATGIVFADEIPGGVTVTVSQAILVDKPVVMGDFDESHTAVSDDSTRFEAGVEVNNGDTFTVIIPVRNEANGDIVVEMDIIYSPNVAAYLTFDLDGSGLIDDVVRFSNWTWKFTADADANGLDDNPVIDGICMVIAVADNAPTGFYNIEGVLHPAEGL